MFTETSTTTRRRRARAGPLPTAPYPYTRRGLGELPLAPLLPLPHRPSLLPPLDQLRPLTQDRAETGLLSRGEALGTDGHQRVHLGIKLLVERLICQYLLPLLLLLLLLLPGLLWLLWLWWLWWLWYRRYVDDVSLSIAHHEHAPNWVAEHLGTSSRRPRHPFPAQMAEVTPGRVPVYTALAHPVTP